MQTEQVNNRKGGRVTLEDGIIKINDDLAGHIDYCTKDGIPSVRVKIGDSVEYVHAQNPKLIEEIIDTALRLREQQH